MAQAQETRGETRKLVIMCPIGLAEQVIALARQGRRPITSQVILLLEEALAQRGESVAA